MRFPRSALVALLVGLAGLVALAPLPEPGSPPRERTVRVEARSFAYTPAVIRVNRGDRVNLEIVSTDVVHGLHIDGYGLSVTADPGQTARVSFVANREGLFRIRCSVTCGPLHPFMAGEFRVGPNRWLIRAIGLAILAAIAGVWVRWR